MHSNGNSQAAVAALAAQLRDLPAAQEQTMLPLWTDPADEAGGTDREHPLARVLAQALSGVTVRMDGKAVGSLVTQTVSENINNAANRGRYAW